MDSRRNSRSSGSVRRGRKLCKTIMLEDTVILSDEEDSKPTTYQSQMEETELFEKSQDEDDEKKHDVSINEAKNVNSQLSEEFETSFLGCGATAKEEKLEQWSTITWELPNFIENLKHYLDNESKYTDENEVTAVRTSLIETGNEIGMYSVFLANLYLRRLTDQNHNVEGHVNLNMPVGANYVAKYHDSQLLMNITIKLVEHSDPENPAHLHFKVTLGTQKQQKIKSFVHFCTAVQNGSITSILSSIEMKTFAQMAPSDRLRITVECCVYRPPIEWGFEKDEITNLTKFMVNGRIKIGDKAAVLKLVDKCKEKGLKGILDCLNTLVKENFFNWWL